jgi:hypothetical protein
VRIAPANPAVEVIERPDNRGPVDSSSTPDDGGPPPPLLRIVAAVKKCLRSPKTTSHPAGLRSAPGEVLDIQVTRAQLDRAIGIANTLLRTLEANGVAVRVDTRRKKTVLDFNDVELDLSIFEQTKRTVREPPKRPVSRTVSGSRGARLPDSGALWTRREYDWHATGRLSISIRGGCNYTWTDTVRTQLERRIPRIVESMLMGVEGVREKRAAEALREAKYQTALASYEGRAARRKSESSRVRQLLRDMRAHDRAERLRAYIERARAAMAESGCSESEVVEWVNWAQSKADWIDPLVTLSDVILDAPAPVRPDRWRFWWPA